MVTDATSAAFATAGSTRRFVTPLVAVRHGERKLVVQVAAGDDHDAFTLGHGGAVHRVRDNWLRFLLWDDTCDFRVDGPTVLDQRCECDPRCTIAGTAQLFRSPGGQSSALFMADEAAWNATSARTTRRHDRKTYPWHGCALDTSKVCSQ